MPFNQPVGFYLTFDSFFMIYPTNYSIDGDLNNQTIAKIDKNLYPQ
jgi:hypothetical protein